MSMEHSAVDSSWDNERVTLGRSFLRDMEGLWAEVLKLAAVVEHALNQSLHALCEGRGGLAEELKHQKRAMDRWEVQIERECVRVLALHQPVASDHPGSHSERSLARNTDISRRDSRKAIGKGRCRKIAGDTPVRGIRQRKHAIIGLAQTGIGIDGRRQI